MPKIDSVQIISRDVELSERFKKIAKSTVHTTDLEDGWKGDGHAVTVLDPDGFSLDESIALIGKLSFAAHRCPVMIFSDRCDRDFVYPLLLAGAGGYVLKSASDTFLSDSLRDLKSGHNPLSSQVASHLMDIVLPRNPLANGDLDFSFKEVELLKLLSRGLTKTQISGETGINVHSVDKHIRKIYRKLEAKSVGEAVAKALRWEIIS